MLIMKTTCNYCFSPFFLLMENVVVLHSCVPLTTLGFSKLTVPPSSSSSSLLVEKLSLSHELAVPSEVFKFLKEGLYLPSSSELEIWGVNYFKRIQKK